MFFTIMIILSIITLLIFIQNKQGKDTTLLRLLSGVCFIFSWLLIVMWFTVLIEGWQIALSAPPVLNNELIPIWGRVVQNLLRSVVFLFPVTRLTLGVLYALPILLIPAVLVVTQQSRMTSILLYSTVISLLFFWVQLIVDNWVRLSFMQIPLQGTVLLTTYVLILYILARQRPFHISPE